MSCVVGIANESMLYMAVDSASGDVARYHVTQRLDSKMFKIGPLIVGFTDSWRMGQLLGYGLKVPLLPKGGVNHKWMCTKFIDAVRKCLADGGWMEKKAERERAGTFLVGVRNRLFAVHADLQVAEFSDGFGAVGCGMYYALGSLCSTMGTSSPRRLRLALRAAAKFSAYVRPPFILKTSKGKEGSWLT